ncbi:MAG TPA: serine hydrolase domain-containing protein [Candidatus Baltobacteraceae bacterium]|jgi:CubicO group peptidase (beta-lactamase class C family)
MLSSRSSSCLLLSLVLIGATPAPAPSAAPPTLAQTLEAIDAFAPVALARQGAPGMSVAIVDKTGVLRIESVGFANRETKEPVTPQTRFGIGSITKSFTASALLQLKDAGRFDDALPVTHYLPWFSIHSAYRPITSHDLFSHSSGLPDGGLSTGYAGPASLRDWFTGYAPGTHWSYSNVGYDTLGAILTTIDRSDYQSIIARRIFAPLEMTHSTTIWNPQTLADAATGYTYADDDRPAPPVHPRLVTTPTTHYQDPAGSVLTTSGDMANYMRYILNGGAGPHGRLLSPASWKLLTSPAITNGKEMGAGGHGMFGLYGYGLADQRIEGDRLVGHTGGVLSYTACMQLDLTRGYGVIAMSNLNYAGPRPCAIVTYAIKALRAYAEGKPLPVAPKADDPLHVDKPAAFAGSYALQGGTKRLVVAANGDRLTLTDANGTYAMYPNGEDSFWIDSPAYAAASLQFGRDAKKRVVEAFFGSQWFTGATYAGPRTFAYPKIWNAYLGHYAAIDADGYYGSVRVIVRKGKLAYDDGTPLAPLGGNLFRVGSDAWTPERVRFTEIIDGKSRILTAPGGALYRTDEP